MRLAVLAVVAACGAAPPKPITNVVSAEQHETMTFRRLEIGKARGHAVRTTFVLDLGHATIDETDEILAKSATVTEGDADPAWITKAKHHYAGTRRNAKDGVQLDLESPDAQPLHLMCADESVSAAAPRAVVTIVPDQPDMPACDGPARWIPDGIQPLPVFSCNVAGQVSADPDDDERLVFARGGVELVDENGDCGRHGGFRRL